MPAINPEDHPSFKIPTNRNIPIWRYMDLSKFISLLSSSALFFCRIEKLGDPFEGRTTKVNREFWDTLKENRGKDPNLKFYADMPDQVIDHFVSNQSKVGDLVRRMHHVNCWHMSEHESAAMWKVYAQSSDAVAIKSTYEKLRKALPRSVYIGEVRYIDYNVDGFNEGNLFNYVLCKRHSFEYERELRAVIIDPTEIDQGASASIDARIRKVEGGSLVGFRMADVMDGVYVSPTSTMLFADVVKDLCLRYGLSVPIFHSSLADDPLD